MQVWILHSALAFFARIKHATELKISLLKTAIFLDFQILHKRNENFCIAFESWKDLSYLDNGANPDILEEKE